MKCETCDTEAPSFAWTDTHGIAQCCTCGTPYTVYHYNEKNEREDKPPLSIVSDEYKPLLRQYWAEQKRRIPSGCSFPGGQELANREDQEAFHAWMDAHADRLKP